MMMKCMKASLEMTASGLKLSHGINKSFLKEEIVVGAAFSIIQVPTKGF